MAYISRAARLVLSAIVTAPVLACSLVPLDPIGAAGAGAISGQGNAASEAERCDAALDYSRAACERAERCGRQWWIWGWDRTTCEHQVASTLTSFIDVGFGFGSSRETVHACAEKLRGASCEPVNDCALFAAWSSKKRELGVECSSTDDCKVGLACLSRACAPLQKEGAACSNSEHCERGLSCQEDACRPVAENVTKCHDDEDCATERLESEYAPFLFWSHGGKFHCDEATLLCKSATRTAKRDEPCGRGNLCESGLHCQGLLGAVGTPSCKPVAKYGEACDDSNCMSCEDRICRNPLEGVCGSP